MSCPDDIIPQICEAGILCGLWGLLSIAKVAFGCLDRQDCIPCWKPRCGTCCSLLSKNWRSLSSRHSSLVVVRDVFHSLANFGGTWEGHEAPRTVDCDGKGLQEGTTPKALLTLEPLESQSLHSHSPHPSPPWNEWEITVSCGNLLLESAAMTLHELCLWRH